MLSANQCKWDSFSMMDLNFKFIFDQITVCCHCFIFFLFLSQFMSITYFVLKNVN